MPSHLRATLKAKLIESSRKRFFSLSVLRSDTCFNLFFDRFETVSVDIRRAAFDIFAFDKANSRCLPPGKLDIFSRARENKKKTPSNRNRLLGTKKAVLPPKFRAKSSLITANNGADRRGLVSGSIRLSSRIRQGLPSRTLSVSLHRPPTLFATKERYSSPGN